MASAAISDTYSTESPTLLQHNEETARSTIYFPPPPTLAPIPPGYPPPPFPIQYPHYYSPPCKCELANQMRYYNHRSREFYYHTALPNSNLNEATESELPVANSPPTPHHYPYPQFYDPYGPFAPPMGPLPPQFHPKGNIPGRPGQPFYYEESGVCELIIVIMALLLWLYSFYRLYLVWQNTLNFNEASIQGPQGWDLLVSWVIERIRIKNLRVPGMSTRRKNGRRGAAVEIGSSVDQGNNSSVIEPNDKEDIELGERTSGGGGPASLKKSASLDSSYYENRVIVAEEDETGFQKKSDARLSGDFSNIASQQRLKQYLMPTSSRGNSMDFLPPAACGGANYSMVESCDKTDPLEANGSKTLVNADVVNYVAKKY